MATDSLLVFKDEEDGEYKNKLHVTEDSMDLSSGSDNENYTSEEESLAETTQYSLAQDGAQVGHRVPFESSVGLGDNQYDQNAHQHVDEERMNNQQPMRDYIPEKYAKHNANTLSSEMYSQLNAHREVDGRKDNLPVWGYEEEGSGEGAEGYSPVVANVEGKNDRFPSQSSLNFCEDGRSEALYDSKQITNNSYEDYSPPRSNDEYLITEDSVNQLKRKYEVRGKEIEDLSIKLDKANKDIYTLKAEKGNLFREKRSLEVRCQGLQNLQQEYEVKTRKLKSGLAKQTNRGDALEEMNKKLEFESESNKGVIKNLEIQVANLMSDDILMKSKHAHDELIRKLKSDHSEELNDMKIKTDSLSNKVGRYESEMVKLQTELNDLRYHKDKLWLGKNQLHNEQLEDLHRLNANLSERLEHSQRELSTSKSELEACQRREESCRKDSEFARTKMNDAESECERLSREARLYKKEATSLQTMLKTLQGEKEKLEAILAKVGNSENSKGCGPHISNLKHHNEQLQFKNNELIVQLEASEREEKKFKNELAMCRQEKEDYSRRLEGLYTEINHLMEKFRLMAQSLKTSEGENKRLIESVNELEAKLRDAQCCRDTLQEQKRTSDHTKEELIKCNQALLKKLNTIKDEYQEARKRLESHEMLLKLGIASNILPPEDSLARLDIAKTLNFDDSNTQAKSKGIENPSLEETALDHRDELNNLNKKYHSDVAELERRLHDSQDTVRHLSSEADSLKKDMLETELRFKRIVEVIAQELQDTREQFNSANEELTRSKESKKELKDSYRSLHEKYNKLKVGAKEQIDHYKGETHRLSSKLINLRVELGVKFKNWLTPFRGDALMCIAEIIEKLNNVEYVEHSLLEPHLVALSMTYQILEKLDITIDKSKFVVKYGGEDL